MDQVQKQLKRIEQMTSKMGVLLVLLVLVILLSVLSPSFLTASNLINILLQVSTTMIIGVGMTFVILTAGIDLSVGSIVAFSGLSMAVFYKYIESLNLTGAAYVVLGLVVPILLAVLIALLIGLINGALISVYKVPAFIMTFGMMEIARGLAYVVSNSNTIALFPPAIRFMGNGKILNIIPIPVVVAAIFVVLASWVLKYTKFGRHVYALGGNREALKLSGVNIHKVEIAVYAISAFFCSVAAIILIGRLNVAEPIAGDGYEMDAIGAVLIGGTSIYGGEGKILYTVVGALLMGTIRNGLNLLNVSSSVQPVVIGSVIILAVFYDMFRKSRLVHHG